MSQFEERVYAYLLLIPKGKVVTYGQIAEALGEPRLARAIGNALHKNPDPDGHPCFRVVNKEGKLAVSFVCGGLAEQQRRLEQDGIIVKDGQVDLSIYQWDGK